MQSLRLTTFLVSFLIFNSACPITIAKRTPFVSSIQRASLSSKSRTVSAARDQQEIWWGRFRGGSYVSPNSITGEEQNNPQSTTTPPSSDLSNHQDTSTAAPSTNLSSSLSQIMEVPEWKEKLPVPLCHKSNRTLQRISIPYQDQTAEIYLLGTAHVSNDSSRDVKLLLQSLHPDVIFVELCDQRTSLMEDPPEVLQQMKYNQTNNGNQTTMPSFWDKVKGVQLQSNNSKFQSIATVLLTSTQEEYADSLGVELGGEFRAAYQYWRSFLVLDNASGSSSSSSSTAVATPAASKRPHLILGDRPLAITLARCWESLSWFGKIKVLVGLILSTFHKPKPEELREWIQKILEDDETDLLKASLEDLRKHFPTLERVIIQERDAYMACKLYQLSRGMLVSAARSSSSSIGNSAENSSNDMPSSAGQYSNSRQVSTKNQLSPQQSHQKPIVIAALVGAGHVPGICAWLTNKSHPQGPEAMLATLIQTKKFKNEDLSQLVYDVTELQDLPEVRSS